MLLFIIYVIGISFILLVLVCSVITVLYFHICNLRCSSEFYSFGFQPHGTLDLLPIVAQETAKKVHEHFAQRARCLEDDLAKSR